MKKTKVTVSLDGDLSAWLKQAAADDGRTPANQLLYMIARARSFDPAITPPTTPAIGGSDDKVIAFQVAEPTPSGPPLTVTIGNPMAGKIRALADGLDTYEWWVVEELLKRMRTSDWFALQQMGEPATR